MEATTCARQSSIRLDDESRRWREATLARVDDQILRRRALTPKVEDDAGLLGGDDEG